MAHKMLTEETLTTNPNDSLLDDLSKIKGILGVMGSLNSGESTQIESEDLGWTLIALREMIEAMEDDLEEAGHQWKVLREFYLARHPSLAAHPTKDQATVNGHPKVKAKVSKEGSRNGSPT